MKFAMKRVYEKPARADGVRVLADRLWPRGMRKEEARVDAWAKDLAPSGALRAWFHADPEKRYKEFSVKYRSELARKKAAARALINGKKKLTLVTAVRNIEHSHVPVLLSFLQKL